MLRSMPLAAVSCRGTSPPTLACEIEKLQPDEVLARVEHAIAVVDAQPGHPTGREQLPDQAVGSGEDLGILHAQANQVIHIEEAPVVDLLGRGPPGCQPVGLRVEQKVQAVEAVRISFSAVEGLECLS